MSEQTVVVATGNKFVDTRIVDLLTSALGEDKYVQNLVVGFNIDEAFINTIGFTPADGEEDKTYHHDTFLQAFADAPVPSGLQSINVGMFEGEKVIVLITHSTFKGSLIALYDGSNVNWYVPKGFVGTINNSRQSLIGAIKDYRC